MTPLPSTDRLVRSAVHDCPDCGAELWIRFSGGSVRIYDLASEYLHVCPTPHRATRRKGRCACGMLVYQRLADGKIENADGSAHEHIAVKGTRGPIPALPEARPKKVGLGTF